MMKSSQFTIHSSQNKNITQLIKRALPANILRFVRKMGVLAEDKDLDAYIIGGFVRDVLLGVSNLDLDIVLEDGAIDFASSLKDKFGLKLIVHKRFGTATITLPSGVKIDFATSRREAYAHPAALPTVTFSSLRNDLYRRDFTINALAIKINKSNFGQLVDLFGGGKDLREGQIRVLHEGSFIDDPTRILRAIRFEQRYNFSLEPKTFKLLRQAIALGLLQRLSRFRLGREFLLLLKENQPQKMVLRFDQLCGLKTIHPLIKFDKKAQARFKAYKAENDWLVYFALLVKKLNAEQLEKLCRDFSMTRNDKQRLKIEIKRISLQ